MSLDEAVAIWLAGMVIASIGVGAIARRHEEDRSWAVLVGPLWPAFLVVGIVIGFFWSLTWIGAWIGRAVQRKFSH